MQALTNFFLITLIVIAEGGPNFSYVSLPENLTQPIELGDGRKFLALTVLTYENDGSMLLKDSCLHFGIPLKVLGYGERWCGFIHKLDLMQRSLEKLSQQESSDKLLVLFVDAFDVIFADTPQNLVARFDALVDGQPQDTVVFGAEISCWPIRELRHVYPRFPTCHYHYLNSGVYMGYLGAMQRLLLPLIKEPYYYNTTEGFDDQLYFTSLYLWQTGSSSTYRCHGEYCYEAPRILLDCSAALMWNMNHMESTPLSWEITRDGKLKCTKTNTHPAILHGNGWLGKINLYNLANYFPQPPPLPNIPQNFAVVAHSTELMIVLFHMNGLVNDEQLAMVVASVENMTFPRTKTHLLIATEHSTLPTALRILTRQRFASIEMLVNANWVVTLETAVQRATAAPNISFLFWWEAWVVLNNSATFEQLISANKSVVAPSLFGPREVTPSRPAWANWWPNATDYGTYRPSWDVERLYLSPVRGLIRVPCVLHAVMLRRDLFSYNFPFKEELPLDPNTIPFVQITMHLRWWNVAMWIDNRHDYGFLLVPRQPARVVDDESLEE